MSMKQVTTEELRRMKGYEGLVFAKAVTVI